MPMTLDEIDAFATTFPGVTVGAKWGRRTWMIHEKGFAWDRPLTKADLARFGDETPPSGEILAVRVEGLDAKDALLAIELPGFFTIPHFNGYAAVLIELRRARKADVRAALEAAFRVVAASAKRKSRKRPAKRR